MCTFCVSLQNLLSTPLSSSSTNFFPSSSYPGGKTIRQTNRKISLILLKRSGFILPVHLGILLLSFIPIALFNPPVGFPLYAYPVGTNGASYQQKNFSHPPVDPQNSILPVRDFLPTNLKFPIAISPSHLCSALSASWSGLSLSEAPVVGLDPSFLCGYARCGRWTF